MPRAKVYQQPGSAGSSSGTQPGKRGQMEPAAPAVAQSSLTHGAMHKTPTQNPDTCCLCTGRDRGHAPRDTPCTQAHRTPRLGSPRQHNRSSNQRSYGGGGGSARHGAARRCPNPPPARTPLPYLRAAGRAAPGREHTRSMQRAGRWALLKAPPGTTARCQALRALRSRPPRSFCFRSLAAGGERKESKAGSLNPGGERIAEPWAAGAAAGAGKQVRGGRGLLTPLPGAAGGAWPGPATLRGRWKHERCALPGSSLRSPGLREGAVQFSGDARRCQEIIIKRERKKKQQKGEGEGAAAAPLLAARGRSRCRAVCGAASSNLFLWLTQGSLHLNVTSRQSINNERGADPS